MTRAMLIAAAVTVGAWVMNGAAVAEKPADAKPVTKTGTLVCGSCKLGETKKCANVLQVKENDKTVNYYVDDKGNKEEYHEGVCGGGAVENVTVTGTVTEKDGKKFIKATKVDVKK